MKLQTPRARQLLGALVAATALLAVGASGAQAKLVKVTGTTTVAPSDGAKQFLANAGVTRLHGRRRHLERRRIHLPDLRRLRRHEDLQRPARPQRRTRVHQGRQVRGAPPLRSPCARASRRAARPDPGASRAAAGISPGAARRFAKKHDRGALHHQWAKLRYPKAAKRVIKATKSYCKQGRVIVLANLTNLGKIVENGSATLTADLHLSAPAAKLINKVAGSKVVRQGRPARERAPPPSPRG